MYQPGKNKKSLKSDVNNSLLIPGIEVSLYGHDLMDHFAVLFDWVYRNEVKRTQCRNKFDTSLILFCTSTYIFFGIVAFEYLYRVSFNQATKVPLDSVL